PVFFSLAAGLLQLLLGGRLEVILCACLRLRVFDIRLRLGLPGGDIVLAMRFAVWVLLSHFNSKSIMAMKKVRTDRAIRPNASLLETERIGFVDAISRDPRSETDTDIASRREFMLH